MIQPKRSEREKGNETHTQGGRGQSIVLINEWKRAASKMRKRKEMKEIFLKFYEYVCDA